MKNCFYIIVILFIVILNCFVNLSSARYVCDDAGNCKSVTFTPTPAPTPGTSASTQTTPTPAPKPSTSTSTPTPKPSTSTSTPTPAPKPTGTQTSTTSSTQTEGGSEQSEAESEQSEFCKDGVKLNTTVPYIGRCIGKQSPETAFPTLMTGISKIIITIIVVTCFLFIVAGGLFISMAGIDEQLRSLGKSLIMKVVVGLFLLGASGVILHVINPNFFK